MRAELANLNHWAVPFLSRAAVNLNWYDNINSLQICISLIDTLHFSVLCGYTNHGVRVPLPIQTIESKQE